MKDIHARSTALSRAPRKGLIALRAAFSMAMIMTGVARTGGRVRPEAIGKVFSGYHQRE